MGLLQSKFAALTHRLKDHSGGQTHVNGARQTLAQHEEATRDCATVQEVESTLSDIDATASVALCGALPRIHSKDYGLCIDCGNATPFERLVVEPRTLRCVACQTFLEQEISP